MIPTRGAPNFDPTAFLGTWHIAITNYGYWKSRIDPTVTYEELPPENNQRRWRDTLRFRKRGLFGSDYKPDTLGGVDVELEPGRFLWRGDGLLKVIKSPWWVLLCEPSSWAVTYFGRSNVGTAPGMDIYGRTPDLDPQLVADILAQVRAHAFLGTRCDGLFATVQGDLSPQRYRL